MNEMSKENLSWQNVAEATSFMHSSSCDEEVSEAIQHYLYRVNGFIAESETPEEHERLQSILNARELHETVLVRVQGNWYEVLDVAIADRTLILREVGQYPYNRVFVWEPDAVVFTGIRDY